MPRAVMGPQQVANDVTSMHAHFSRCGNNKYRTSNFKQHMSFSKILTAFNKSNLLWLILFEISKYHLLFTETEKYSKHGAVPVFQQPIIEKAQIFKKMSHWT